MLRPQSVKFCETFLSREIVGFASGDMLRRDSDGDFWFEDRGRGYLSI